ncbi:MAG: hypothetical protein FJX62_02745 [Alphaproteobacteria bacterium]|nr:hypothetical protein [Alphaproteobacteria bacterium]
MMSRTILFVAFGLAIAGCQTVGPSAAQRDEERCAAAGHKPNTDAFKSCLLDQETARTVRRDSRHREMLERSANPLPR